MPYKDIRRRRKYHREYLRRRWKSKMKLAQVEWYRRNRERIAAETRQLRLEVLSHYGGYPPRCACCGEATYAFLSLDHIGGGGYAHRKATHMHVYKWAKRHGFPEGFRVLCMNCNWGERMEGQCPHLRPGRLTTCVVTV
jgi:hypothetical protein